MMPLILWRDLREAAIDPGLLLLPVLCFFFVRSFCLIGTLDS